MDLRDSPSGLGVYQAPSLLPPEPHGREDSQEYSHPPSDVDIQVVVGSGPSREENDANGKKLGHVYPPPSAHPSGKPDSMWTCLFHSLPLIVPSGVINTSAVPDHVPEVPHPNQNLEPSVAVDENKLSLKSAASLLRTVRDSSDAFPPLKSVAGDLCVILESPEVRPTSRSPDPRRL